MEPMNAVLLSGCSACRLTILVLIFWLDSLLVVVSAAGNALLQATSATLRFVCWTVVPLTLSGFVVLGSLLASPHRVLRLKNSIGLGLVSVAPNTLKVLVIAVGVII